MIQIKPFIQKFKQNKKLFWAYNILLYSFAIYGFILVFTFFGIRLHIFNDPGGVDRNDRFFELGSAKIKKAKSIAAPIAETAKVMTDLNIINQLYPLNAQLIYNAFLQHHNISIAQFAIQSVKIRLNENVDYIELLKNPSLIGKKKYEASNQSLFEWMNIEEWETFKFALEKDAKLIDSVAKLTDVDHRMIVAALVGEQMRLFNSTRETYKKVIKPLKVLSVESQFSLGVTGIKEHNAILVENYLKDSTSEYYLGKKYEHLLDFSTQNPTKERYDRLVDYRNHFWSYMYAAVIIKQFETQWRKAGFDISDRPEILITLFNVGFPHSIPNANPKVGGSRVHINGINYTFGSLGYEFYYSGELIEIFPYKNAVKLASSSQLNIEYSKARVGAAPNTKPLDSNLLKTDSIQKTDSILSN